MKETGNCTIYEVAKEAGVSITTVSRVLHGKTTVSPKTRERIEEVIRRLDYRPSAIARGLTGKGTNTLGIILPRLVNPNYALIFNGAYEEARRHGYAVSLFPWKSLNSQDYNPALMLAERRLDGVIVNVEYLAQEDEEMLHRELNELKRYMPVVLIGCVPKDLQFPTISYNHAACMRQIMKYLVGLGHERIAFIGGMEADQDEYRRDVGYMDGLQAAKLPFVSSYRVFCDATAEAGERAMAMMLADLQPKYWPTAVITINDLVALGCRKAAQERKLKIPEDMSLIGCDNLFFTPYCDPPLTSIDTKQQEMGARAVQMIIEGRQGREEAQWELIERNSCGRVKEK